MNKKEEKELANSLDMAPIESDGRQEAIETLEKLHGQLSYQEYKLRDRIRTLKDCIDELRGKKGKISQS